MRKLRALVLLPFATCVFLTVNGQEPTTLGDQKTVKEKGIALLAEMDGLIAQIKTPVTRIKAQLQAAELIWSSDEKRAAKYFADATTGFREYLASLDSNSENYPMQFQSITELRFQIVHILADRDPDAALNFLYSSKPPANPYDNNRRFNTTQEGMLELAIANQVSRTDPNRALQIARQSLKTRYSINLVSTVGLLGQKNPEMAAQFASEIATKLLSEKLLTKPDAASVVTNLLRIGQEPVNGGSVLSPNSNTPRITFLRDDQYRELLQKAVTEALSYRRPASGISTPERDAALNLLYGLRQFEPQLEALRSGTVAALDKKLLELGHQYGGVAQYQTDIAKYPVDTALTIIESAPQDQREQLYVQLAIREANNGGLARAKQIISERVTNPAQRRNALSNIDQQEIQRALGKGKADEALRITSGLRTSRERTFVIAQIAGQIGSGLRRADAINVLAQARSLLGSSAQAQDQDQMNALIEIAQAFGPYEPKRSFEVIDPLIDQMNEMCAALRTLEGFGQENFEDEELNLQNGNSVPRAATLLASALGKLALFDFERSKAAADRLRLPEVRLKAYVEIAQQTIKRNADLRR